MNKINIDLLIKLRKKHHLNQSELAKRVGVTRFAINGIEKERMSPSLSLIIRIAEVLNCKVDDLIFFKDGVYLGDTNEISEGDSRVKHSN